MNTALVVYDKPGSMVLDLGDLADQIRREHAAAQGAVRDSLAHARRAGDLLLRVKGQLPHGEFGRWIAANCPFAHRTATLYMRVAREWERLEEKGNAVATFGLGEVAQLLSRWDDDVELEPWLEELTERGVLDPADLDGLSPHQTRLVVTELKRAYDGYVEDPERGKHFPQTPGLMTTDVPTLRSIGHEAIEALKQTGEEEAFRDSVRLLERLNKNRPDGGRSPVGERCTYRRPVPGPFEPVNPLERYWTLAERFIPMTRTLLTEPQSNGLLEEFVRPTPGDRDRLVAVIADARTALDSLEAALSAPEPSV